MKQDCNEENKRIEGLQYDMVVTKKYNADHSGWLEGKDDDGKIQKFQYTSFIWLDDSINAGDKLLKDSGDMKFTVVKNNIKYIFKWDCQTSGELLKTDALNKK